jgi:hypothetical protein
MAKCSLKQYALLDMFVRRLWDKPASVPSVHELSQLSQGFPLCGAMDMAEQMVRASKGVKGPVDLDVRYVGKGR